MTNVPFITSDWRRETAQEPVLKIQNRYFEVNPANFEKGSALILRPGFRRFTLLDTASTKGLYASQGLFRGFIFALTSSGVIQVQPDGTPETLLVVPASIPHNNQGTFTGAVGSTPGYFFCLLGNLLWVIAEVSFAHNRLTASGTIENNAVVQIGDMYYKFTTGSVDTGTPDGSSGNPWLVARVATSWQSMNNLFHAMTNVDGDPGTDYSTATTRNPLVNPIIIDSLANTFDMEASIAGSSGNGIPVSVSATSVLSWTASEFFGGNDPDDNDHLTQFVFFPISNINFIALTTFNAYVILVAKGTTSEFSGRFYWLQPGSTQIDPLDFASTEMAPDTLISVRAVTDFLWFFGAETIEIWYSTGDPATPFARNKGQAFNFGIFRGTDQVIENDIMFISRDYKVRQVSGTSAEIVSNPGIEEQIRNFVETDTDATTNSIRTWWTNFDGHLAYFVNLGETRTLVFDLVTKQWMEWDTQDQDYLVPTAGIPALSPFSGYPDERYLPIAGDLGSGQLWWVDPEYHVDDAPGDTENVTLIPATATAGVPMVGRDTARNGQLYLAGSVGNPSVVAYYLVDGDGGPILIDGPGGPYLLDSDIPFSNYDFFPASIQLEISDDNGKTWWNAGEREVIVNDFTQEIAWRSLGIISAPGRLFRFNDYGAMVRLDRMDIF